MFNNRWEIAINEMYILSDISTRLLRGGPSMRISPSWENSILFNTDRSKRVSFRLQNSSSLNTDGITHKVSVRPGLSFRLGNHIYMMSEFNYTRNVDNLLYITQVSSAWGKQYILGRISQNTYNLTLRFNYNITPDISIQYYGSPFVSNGSFTDLKKATNTRADDRKERYHSFTVDEVSYDPLTNNYFVNENGINYSFNRPDFSFREFRSNLVARWEYLPGSTLYLVWENNRRSRESAYYPSLDKNIGELFGVNPTNIFMVKLSYWFAI
jgi:hypothetical protein